MIIFFALLRLGLNHTKGKTNGPTERKPITIVEILKYHLVFGFWVKGLPQ